MHCFVTGFGFDARNFQDAGGAFTLLYWLRDTDYADYRLMYAQWIEADILILKAIDFFSYCIIHISVDVATFIV